MARVVPKAPQALRRRHEPSEAIVDEMEKIVEVCLCQPIFMHIFMHHLTMMFQRLFLVVTTVFAEETN